MIDFSNREFLSGDRTAAYAALRKQAPVWHMGEEQGVSTWVLSRHADVQAVLRMPGGRVQPPGMDAPPWFDEGPARDRLRANLAQTDAPIHTRLRSVIGPMFIPRRIEGLRAVSADSVARALSAMARQNGEFDLVQEIAAQVPKGVICHLLGIPEADWERLIAVQHDFLNIFSPFPLSAEQKGRLDAVVLFYRNYFGEFLDNADPAQCSTIVQLLLAAEGRGEISRTETISVMHTVLDAGYETTRTSISNAVELLAGTPGLFDQLRSKPDAITNAVEEILRIRTPIHVRHRFLAEAYTASDGTVIPAGSQALLMLAAANQDEAIFDEPLRVDFERANASRHQAFGGGLHHCLGAPIARIQLQETLRGLVSGYSKLSLSRGKGERYPSLKFPALSSLMVIATPVGAEAVEPAQQDGEPGEGGDAAFVVELAKSGGSVEVPAGTSILQALEDAGYLFASSCGVGTCGTCEVGVLEGTPDHRDSILTAEEKAAGKHMMICVSRARSHRLVLDI